MKRRAGLTFLTCRECGKRWNVSRTDQSGEKYMCPQCYFKNGKTAPRGTNSESGKGKDDVI